MTKLTVQPKQNRKSKSWAISFFKNLLKSAPKYALYGVLNQQNKKKEVGSGVKNNLCPVVQYCPCPLFCSFANL
jgi:hypothetical protein